VQEYYPLTTYRFRIRMSTIIGNHATEVLQRRNATINEIKEMISNEKDLKIRYAKLAAYNPNFTLDDFAREIMLRSH
jgi:hypothetical protein